MGPVAMSCGIRGFMLLVTVAAREMGQFAPLFHLGVLVFLIAVLAIMMLAAQLCSFEGPVLFVTVNAGEMALVAPSGSVFSTIGSWVHPCTLSAFPLP